MAKIRLILLHQDCKWCQSASNTFNIPFWTVFVEILWRKIFLYFHSRLNFWKLGELILGLFHCLKIDWDSTWLIENDVTVVFCHDYCQKYTFHEKIASISWFWNFAEKKCWNFVILISFNFYIFAHNSWLNRGRKMYYTISGS